MHRDEILLSMLLQIKGATGDIEETRYKKNKYTSAFEYRLIGSDFSIMIEGQFWPLLRGQIVEFGAAMKQLIHPHEKWIRSFQNFDHLGKVLKLVGQKDTYAFVTAIIGKRWGVLLAFSKSNPSRVHVLIVEKLPDVN